MNGHSPHGPSPDIPGQTGSNSTGGPCAKPFTPPDAGEMERMFNCIAPRYDLLNRLLSMGVDRRWRRRLALEASLPSPALLLDLATGTGDVAIALASKNPNAHIHGVDVSEGMLLRAQKKIARQRLSHRITLAKAPAEALPYPNQHFDVVTVAFGVRNFDDPHLGLREIRRVLKPGGMLLVLEFASPTQRWLGALFSCYFQWMLPLVGRLVSGHRSAYTYLPQSVAHFPAKEQFIDMLHQTGFTNATYTLLTGGIASLYRGLASPAS